MQSTNFKCPKTGKEYSIQKYRITTEGYTDENGRELVSEEGVTLVPIEIDKGFPTAIYGTTDDRVARNQKYFKERAAKHTNSLDMKIQKQERAKEELKRYTNK